MHTGKLLIFQIIKINVLFGQLFTCLKNTMIYCPWSSGACDVDHGMDYGRMNVFVSGEISFWKQKQHASRHVISKHTTYRSLIQNLVHPLPHPQFTRIFFLWSNSPLEVWTTTAPSDMFHKRHHKV